MYKSGKFYNMASKFSVDIFTLHDKAMTKWLSLKLHFAIMHPHEGLGVHTRALLLLFGKFSLNSNKLILFEIQQVHYRTNDPVSFF